MPSPEDSETAPNILSEKQRLILEGFLAEHKPANAETLSAADWASTDMRRRLSDFGIHLETDTEYFAVMVGMVVGTTVMQGIMDEVDAPPDVAGEVTRVTLNNLYPQH